MKALTFCWRLALAIPAAAVSATAIAAPAMHAARFTVDTPIETLMADPGAKAVLDRYLPDLADNPHYFMIKAGSLKDLAAHAGGSFNAALLAKMQAELAQVP